MPKLLSVQAKPGYRLWLAYDDGAEGEVDVSGLVGRGVFAAWRDQAFFDDVELSGAGARAWRDSIDLCPDALYLELTGRAVEQRFPGLRRAASDA
jgi:hypothetical protein